MEEELLETLQKGQKGKISGRIQMVEIGNISISRIALPVKIPGYLIRGDDHRNTLNPISSSVFYE